MISARLLPYINSRLSGTDGAKASLLGISKTKYSRISTGQKFELKISELSHIIGVLSLNPDEVYFVLTGKVYIAEKTDLDYGISIIRDMLLDVSKDVFSIIDIISQNNKGQLK